MGRVWAESGLWNPVAWRREPEIEKINLCILQGDEKLWLYRVEDPIIMVEVHPIAPDASGSSTIGQVVLRRLMTAEQAIERLSALEAICQMNRPGSPGLP